MSIDMDKKWEEFEKDGEKLVRQKLANRIYGEANILAANAWLELKTHQRAESSKSEEMDIARSAVAAAESAVAASRRAADAVEAQASEMRAARKEARIAIMIAAIVAGIEIIDKWDKIKIIFSF